MEIQELDDNGNVLKIVVSSNEESLFYLLKSYLDSMKDVDLVGVAKDHYLLDKTEFYLKVNGDKKSAKDLFKKALVDIKKDLLSKKVK